MKRLAVTIILLLLFLPGQGADIEFTASVDAETVGLEDYVVYTVTFKGIQNPSPPDVSEIGDFNIIQTSRSSEFKFINGVSSSYIHFIYYLAPLKTGTLIIPPLRYVHNNDVMRTPRFRIVAVKGGIKKVTPGKRRRSLFDMDEDLSPFESFRKTQREVDVKLRGRISRTRAQTGEQLIYRVMLYSRNRIESVNLVSGQSFPGFWQEWYPVNKTIDGTSEVHEGKTYQVYEIRKAALFPTRSGELTIPPVKFEMVLSDNTVSFFSTPRRITRSSDALKIQVESNPGFQSGLPVGKMNISAKPDQTEIDINELITIRVSIRGYGNMKTVSIPDFKSSSDYKVFPAKVSRNIDYRETGVYGIVSAEVPVSFKRTGEVVVPSMDFSYFDPSESKIITTGTNKFTVLVTGKREKVGIGAEPVAGGVSKIGSDIDFIIKGEIRDQRGFLYKGVFYRLVLLLLVGVIVLVPVYEKIIKSKILGSKSFQNKKGVRDILKRLEAVREYGEFFQIIEEYLEKKTGMRRSEMTSAKVENLFDSRGIGKADTAEFLRIRSESELSRFSGSTIKTVSQVREETEHLIRIIRRIDGRIK